MALAHKCRVYKRESLWCWACADGGCPAGSYLSVPRSGGYPSWEHAVRGALAHVARMNAEGGS